MTTCTLQETGQDLEVLSPAVRYLLPRVLVVANTLAALPVAKATAKGSHHIQLVLYARHFKPGIADTVIPVVTCILRPQPLPGLLLLAAGPKLQDEADHINPNLLNRDLILQTALPRGVLDLLTFLDSSFPVMLVGFGSGLGPYPGPHNG